MAIANKETYINGQVALDIYEDGRIFITVDRCGLFITPEQIGDLYDLLAGYRGEYNDLG